MLRAIILVLVLFVSIGTIIPIATDYAEAGAKKTQWRKKKKQKRYKSYRRYITTSYVKGKKTTRKYRKPTKSTTPKRYKKTRKSKSSTYKKPRSSKTYRKARSPKKYKKTRRYSRSTSKRTKSKRYTSSKRYKKSPKYVKARKTKTRKYAKAKTTRSVRKYSKKWWSSYRAKVRRQKAIAKRKQNLRLRRIRLAKQNAARRNSVPRVSSKVSNTKVISISGNAVLPGWMKEKLRNEIRSNSANNTNPANSNPQTNSDLIVVTDAVSSESGRKDVAGVAISDLRRIVIDKMIQEQGWVVNDIDKYVNGKKVFVVIAKSPGTGGTVKSRIFYFTESKGQIYSLSTVAPDDSNTQIVDQSERLVKTLQSTGGSVQSAKKD